MRSPSQTHTTAIQLIARTDVYRDLFWCFPFFRLDFVLYVLILTATAVVFAFGIYFYIYNNIAVSYVVCWLGRLFVSRSLTRCLLRA